MGHDVFYMGVIMRLGGYSRVKRSLIYGVCVSLCLVTYQRPAYAIIPQILWLAKMYDQAVASRALQASEVQFHQRMLQALESQGYYLNRAVRNEITAFRGSSWNINGSFAWGAVASAASADILTLTDLNVSSPTEEIMYISDGVPNGDGTYQVIIAGKEETVKFMPNVKNPVIVKFDRTSDTPNIPKIDGVGKDYNLPQNALYYLQDYSSKYYHYGVDSTINIAESYLQDIFLGNSLYQTKYSSIDDGNYQYSYVSKGYLFNFEHVGTDKGSSVYPDFDAYQYIAGLPITTKEIFKVTVRTFTLSPDVKNNLCRYTTNENNQSVYSCSPPLFLDLPDSHLLRDYPSVNPDYVFSDSILTESVLIKVNTSYIPAVSSKNYTFGSTAEMVNDLSLLNDYKIPVDKLTKLLNALMMNAASMDGYDGLPFSSSNLFTQQEIKQAIQDIGHHPTLYDWYAVGADSSGLLNLDPKNTYLTIYNNTTNNNTNNKENVYKLEFGDFEPPELEETPDDFLGFLDDAFPFLRDFELDEKAVDCPIYYIDAFGKTYTIETHCPLLEQNRPLTEMIMLIVWAFVSLRIVLKA